MQLRLVFPNKNVAKRAKNEIEELVVEILNEEFIGSYVYEVVIDPGNFRAIDDVVSKHTRGSGSVETIETYVSGNTAEDAYN